MRKSSVAPVCGISRGGVGTGRGPASGDSCAKRVGVAVAGAGTTLVDVADGTVVFVGIEGVFVDTTSVLVAVGVLVGVSITTVLVGVAVGVAVSVS